MKPIPLLIFTESPLALGQAKTGSSVSNVESYISGTVIRGAVAGIMLRQAQAEGQDFSQAADSDFKALFIEHQAIFQNAYPALTENLKCHADVRVVPATALSAKNASGFKSTGNGVFDTLIDRFCAEAYGIVYDPNCPIDGGRVDSFPGFYSVEDGVYHSHSSTTRLLTRVGINRRRNTAEDQVLYSIQVLNEFKRDKQRSEEMVFASTIWVREDLADTLRNYLNAQANNIRLGGSVSRGLGKVRLELPERQPEPTLTKRIEDLNQTLKTRWQRWQIFQTQPQVPIDHRCFFTLGLQSEAILTENWLRSMVISERILQNTTGLTRGDLKLHAAYSSSGQRSGWNAAWELPKDITLITNSGSVFLFSIDKIELNHWQPKLAELEIQGIGQATSEGFGQIRVCDQFHNILREAAV
jgi:CRISPR-associated protein Csx10